MDELCSEQGCANDPTEGCISVVIESIDVVISSIDSRNN